VAVLLDTFAEASKINLRCYSRKFGKWWKRRIGMERTQNIQKEFICWGIKYHSNKNWNSFRTLVGNAKTRIIRACCLCA